MSIWLLSGSFCVRRGCGWSLGPQYAQVAICSFDDPAIRSRSLGVRLVRRMP